LDFRPTRRTLDLRESTLRYLQIGFSKPKGILFPWFSWAIRLVDKSPFSHCYIRLQTKYESDLIYQASGVQVNFTGFKFFNKHVEIYKEFLFTISEESYFNLMKFCIENAGAPYSIRDILAIFIYKMTGHKIKSKKENGFVCSELVGTILKDFIDQRLKDQDVDFFTPKDIFELCRMKEQVEGN